MNPWKKVILIILSILLGIGLLIGGGYLYMKHKQQEEQAYMEKVVYSDEAARLFRENCKNLDPKAFTKEGVIQSYTIDKSSIKHNPMGGINVTIIINHDKELNVQDDIDKYNEKLEIGGSVISVKLDKLLEENK